MLTMPPAAAFCTTGLGGGLGICSPYLVSSFVYMSSSFPRFILRNFSTLGTEAGLWT